MFLDNFNFVFAKGRMQPPPPPPTPVIAIHKILTTVRWGGIWGGYNHPKYNISSSVFGTLGIYRMHLFLSVFYLLFYEKWHSPEIFLKGTRPNDNGKGGIYEKGSGLLYKKGEGAPIRRKRVGLLMKNEKEACVNVWRCLPMSVSITRLVYLPDAYRIG